MSIRKTYNTWAKSYDEMINKTRDLEAKALRETITSHFNNIVELGCGTGKNTSWLLEKCESLIALDFSEEMLAKARKKISSEKVSFKQHDLSKSWNIKEESTDLICCSLVLEHIEDLDSIFKKAAEILKKDGQFYIGELHPFKQYAGSKARFETDEGIQELEVFVHHITDFTDAAFNHGFKLLEMKEWFDGNDRKGLPRLVSFVFSK